MFVFAYGVCAYLAFVFTSLYAFGFVEGWGVMFSLDGVRAGGGTGLGAVLSNAILLALFGLQHAFMGHPAVKRAWTSLLPAAAHRGTHVLVSCLFLMLVFLRWKALPLELWSLGLNPLGLVLELLSYAGWALALTGTFQFDHLQLFGLAQALAHVKGEELEPARFDVPYLYRWVRHPIYFGLLLALWCAPVMTLGRVLFAGLATGYFVLLARMEERELVHEHREYRAYQARVPMLLPRTRPLPLRRRAG